MYSYQIQGNMPSIIQGISTNTRKIQRQKERSKDGYKYLTGLPPKVFHEHTRHMGVLRFVDILF